MLKWYAIFLAPPRRVLAQSASGWPALPLKPAMGYDENGVWLGHCPSFTLDTESCCISLNV